MTREFKIQRITDLQKVKEHYQDAIILMQGYKDSEHPGLRYVGVLAKVKYYLGLISYNTARGDYEKNILDTELRDVVVDYMKKKIAEIDTEIDGYLCGDDDDNTPKGEIMVI